MLTRVKENWDELLASSALIVYGVAAFIRAPASLEGTPEFFAALFNAEFILAGVLLILGILLGSVNLRIIGFTFFILNFVVIAAIVAFASGSVVSILLLAIALFAYSFVRDLLKTREELRKTFEVIRNVR